MMENDCFLFVFTFYCYFFKINIYFTLKKFEVDAMINMTILRFLAEPRERNRKKISVRIVVRLLRHQQNSHFFSFCY